MRRQGDAEAEHGGVAEPECQSGDEADLRHFHRVEAVGGIDPVTHGTAGEHGGADIVADGIAGEAGQRRDAIGNLPAADRAQGEPVVEGQREIAERDEQAGGGDAVPLSALQCDDNLVHLDVAQHMHQHHRSHGDDGEAEQHADPVPADLVLEKAHHGARSLEHSSSGPPGAQCPDNAPDRAAPPVAEVVRLREGVRAVNGEYGANLAVRPCPSCATAIAVDA